LPRWLVMTGAALLVTGLAIAGMVAGVARVERLLPHSAPVRPELAIERVEFRPAEIIVHVRITGAAAIQISQVAVDDGYRLFEHRGDGRLARLDATELRIPYPWIAGEPVHLSILAADGARFDHDVEAVALTPVPGGRSIAGYAAVGSFVGLLPVFAGLALLPGLRRLSRSALRFVLGITGGMLVFLAVD